MYAAVDSWFVDRDESKEEIRKSLSLIENVSFESYVNGLEAMYEWSGEKYLKMIKTPTLVIWGDSDKSYQWDKQPYELWTKIENCSLSVVSNSAHNVHLEKPQQFNLILSDFINSVTE
ncbi:hypothetical protein VSU01S_15650 [Vibrio superstes NBRC 103154]|uniref:AB hydrolase-1 domain-containing protein n=2 Tax=Vibrio superstes TaxID=198815 RepID=A0A511QPR6_9VIBR|nr:hypothetical protein VSU01S_15650 [Vibrio superstes NBRC 103154]